MDEIHCTGNEEWLSACPHSGYGTNGCKHNEDVAIICTGKCLQNDCFCYAILNTGPDVIRELRLAGGDDRSGRVEIKVNNMWAQICGDLWNFTDASVVCRYLGFNTTQPVPQGDKFGMNSSGYWLTEMQCNGQETNLNLCQYALYDNNGSPSSTCATGYPANVDCSGTINLHQQTAI